MWINFDMQGMIDASAEHPVALAMEMDALKDTFVYSFGWLSYQFAPSLEGSYVAYTWNVDFSFNFFQN